MARSHGANWRNVRDWSWPQISILALVWMRMERHPINANAINAVLGANSVIALASSMNDPSIALVAFNIRQS